MEGALDENERPDASNANANPETGSAKRDAENERDGPRNAALRESPRTSGKERQSEKGWEDQERESGRSPAAVNAIDEERINNERNGEWDGIEDTDPADSEAEGRKRREEEARTDENGRLANGGDPGVSDSVGVSSTSQGRRTEACEWLRRKSRGTREGCECRGSADIAGKMPAAAAR